VLPGCEVDELPASLPLVLVPEPPGTAHPPVPRQAIAKTMEATTTTITTRFTEIHPSARPGGYIFSLSKGCAQGERSTNIDLPGLLRVGLAVVTAGFLLAACIASIWRTGSDRRSHGTRSVFVILSVALLIALSTMLAVRPALGSGASTLGQALLLAAAAALFAVSLSLRKRTPFDAAQLLDAATVDALTRIASHRVFQDRLAHECERAYRFGDTFMLLMLDLDDFRPVNNRYGHRTGDRILLELARRLRAQLREIDLVARFAGDQFAMILPHTYEKGGVEVAERLRQNVAGWVFLTRGGLEIRLTVSLGLCSYPRDGATAPELVDAAQKALGFAKAMGGNQAQLSRDLPSREAPDNVISLPHSGRGAIVRGLAAAVDLRDGYTHKHSQLVSELSAAIARRMGLPTSDVTQVSDGAYLHDVGKIGVPDAILTKADSLSGEEWASIRGHPILGKQIIEQCPELADVIPLVLHHQEHYDGSGYPYHLRGEDIPLGARIIAAADAYHAIRSDRPYRSGRTHQEATRELKRCTGYQFDPRVVSALVAVLDTDPELQAILPPDAETVAPAGPAARRAPVIRSTAAARGR
jgi:diguanylate cyclase (GGDEF)-like protein